MKKSCYIDRKEKNFGVKNTLLEATELLIPLVAMPDKLCGQYVRLFIDNINVVYAWEKKQCKDNTETSVVIRAIHLIEARLGCKIYVEHLRRLSTRAVAMTDRFSRKSSMTAEDRAVANRLGWVSPAGTLANWLANPTVDWELGEKIISDIECKIAK